VSEYLSLGGAPIWKPVRGVSAAEAMTKKGKRIDMSLSSNHVREQPPFERGVFGGIGTKPESEIA
jgi:hypothetical protein